MQCLLCSSDHANEFYHDNDRHYHHCRVCKLTFVHPEQFLSPEEEKKRYDLHQNSPEDKAYRQFLSRLFNPLKGRLLPGSRGLDFGSGPGPTLSVMLEEIGHSMELYDHYYAKHPINLTRQYDFITATEVLEHLYHPKEELDRLWACLHPGGKLGVMTKLAPGPEAFPAWHYKNELTHVCFFSKSTFEWLAAKWRADMNVIGQDVIIIDKLLNVGVGANNPSNPVLS
jgi:hypothetical protein